jgi:hypothetical protein
LRAQKGDTIGARKPENLRALALAASEKCPAAAHPSVPSPTPLASRSLCGRRKRLSTLHQQALAHCASGFMRASCLETLNVVSESQSGNLRASHSHDRIRAVAVQLHYGPCTPAPCGLARPDPPLSRSPCWALPMPHISTGTRAIVRLVRRPPVHPARRHPSAAPRRIVHLAMIERPDPAALSPVPSRTSGTRVVRAARPCVTPTATAAAIRLTCTWTDGPAVAACPVDMQDGKAPYASSLVTTNFPSA